MAELTERSTRHLCAAAYLDEDFARQALQAVYDQPRRMVAPSYGFDIVPVLAHCKKAHALNMMRDAIITGVLLIGFCVLTPAVLALALILILLHLTVQTWRLVRDMVVKASRGTTIDLQRLLMRGFRLMFGYLAGGVGLILFTFFFSTLLVLLPLLLLGSSGGGGDDDVFSGVLFFILIMAGVLVFVVPLGMPIGTSMIKHAQMERFALGRRVTLPVMSPRLAEIRQAPAGNVIGFSGYRPFVGAGYEMNQWSAALRLIRRDADPLNPAPEAQREFGEPPFGARQLYEYVEHRMETLRAGQQPELILPGLTVESRVFLAAREYLGFPSSMDQAQVDQIIAHPVHGARNVLVCRVESWQGELITNVFAHFAVQGRTLYLELSSWALPPCEDRFLVIDDQENAGGSTWLRALREGFLNTPRIVGAAPLNLLRSLAQAMVSSGRRRRRTEQEFDYGAAVSVRELAMSRSWRNSLLEDDFVKYSGIVERRIIAAVYDFLELHDVDMTEFRQRTVSILNKGIMNTGSGSVTNSGAVGDQATVLNVASGRD